MKIKLYSSYRDIETQSKTFIIFLFIIKSIKFLEKQKILSFPYQLQAGVNLIGGVGAGLCVKVDERFLRSKKISSFLILYSLCSLW